EVDGQPYRDLAHARTQIGSFIEEVYNRQRLHSALDYLTPEEYDAASPPLQQGRASAAMASINLTCL
ncbi:integrase core domain-containing protein, partial [Inquilinus sp. 2KB_23]